MRCQGGGRGEGQADVGGKGFPYIFPCGDERRALLYQGVGAPGLLVGYVPGHGKNVATLLQGASRRDPGSAIFPGFNHQHANRHAADKPVADGKILRRRKGAQRKLRRDCATRGENLLGELLVFLGINLVDAGAPNGDGAAVRVQGSAMGQVSTPRAMPLKMTSPWAARSQARRSAMPMP